MERCLCWPLRISLILRVCLLFLLGDRLDDREGLFCMRWGCLFALSAIIFELTISVCKNEKDSIPGAQNFMESSKKTPVMLYA